MLARLNEAPDELAPLDMDAYAESTGLALEPDEEEACLEAGPEAEYI